jgi:hypothetical protein
MEQRTVKPRHGWASFYEADELDRSDYWARSPLGEFFDA